MAAADRHVVSEADHERDAAALRLVATVSHELRGPLHAVLGLSELLRDRIDDVESERLLRAVRREAEAMGVIISDLLDYSRAESGEIALTRTSFSPAQAIHEVVESTRQAAARKGLAVTLIVQPDVHRWVAGDAVRYRQVVRNLLTNAVRYTDHGTIHVTVSLSAPDPAYLVCEVADTGIGIPIESQASIFEPFVRAHGNRQGGTGLGLAVSARLAELLGGHIAVESEAGSGSVFRFTAHLPETSERPPRRRDTLVDSGKSGRVLVVEDSQVNRMLAAGQLEQLGWEAVLAETGEEAVEIFATDEFVAVLMDWNLPGIDGLEATLRIRQSGHLGAHVPVIAMTANALAGDRDRCIAAGMNDFLTKPVGLDDLAAVLSRWTDLSSPSGTEPRHNRSVDDAILAALEAELGDPALVDTLVDSFVDELSDRTQTIRASVDDNDLESLRRAAHTLKSTAALVGATDLAGLCDRLCHVESLAEAHVLPVRLLEEADDVRRALDLRAQARRVHPDRLRPGGGHA